MRTSLLVFIAAIALASSCKKEEKEPEICKECQVITRKVPQPYVSMAIIDTTSYLCCQTDTVQSAIEGLSYDEDWYIYRTTSCE